MRIISARLPYLADDLGVPLYATPFTAGLIRGKLEEEGNAARVRLNVVKPGERIGLGPFGVSYRAAVALDPRGQCAADRHALWPHLPHRRLEAR